MGDYKKELSKCSNPKCITQQEEYVEKSFTLINKNKEIYLCDYCHGENKAEYNYEVEV